MDLVEVAFKAWGAPGLCMGILGATVIYLYLKIDKIQEKRIQENKENSDKNAQLARELGVTLVALTQATQSLREVILSRHSRG